MHITSFHIDGFGIFSNVDVPELPRGLSIFFGHNEAGKSTCLEFLRVMLTGYPDSRRKEARERLNPVHGGTAGGSLVLEYQTPGGSAEILRLTRRPASGDGLSLFRTDGAQADASELGRIFSGVNQDVYRKVFGFSLGELERFETLSDAGVRNALYGASFGPGLASPADALKILQKQMDDLYKPNGSKTPLNAALRRMEELAQHIRECKDKSASYDDLCALLGRQQSALENIRQSKKDLERERRLLEQRLGVWRQWDEWRQAMLQMEQLPVLPDDFPEDALARYARVDEGRQSCEQQIVAQKKKLEAQRERLEAFSIDQSILRELPFLRQLAERKSGYRQAISHINSHRESCQRAQADLQHNLAQLGPDWNCERIRATDRSLFAREDLEKQARNMTAAVLAHQAARDYLARANKDLEHSRSELQAAISALDALPNPAAELNEQERDELKRNMDRLEDCRRLAPRREEALKNARMIFSRSVKQLNILDGLSEENPDPDRFAAANAAIDSLMASRQQALQLAEEIDNLLGESAKINISLAQKDAELEGLKKSLEDKVAERRKSGGATRETLETKSKALRNLRTAKSQLDALQQKIEDLDQRIASDPAPQKRRNWPVICVASVFMILGAALFAGSQFMGLHEFAISPDLILPVTMPYAYSALALGVLLLALGLPGNSEELNRHRAMMAQVTASRESAAMQLAGTGAKVARLCAEAGIENADPVIMDATELRLEREKERCINDERSLREIEELKLGIATARDQLAALQKDAHEMENQVQAARRRWHGLMEGLNVQRIPSPESADTIFAQLNSARTAWENVVSAQTELDALWEDLHLLEESITRMPPVAHRLSSAPEPLSIEAAVRDTLAACSEAERVREQRQRAQGIIESANAGFMRAQSRQEEASAGLKDAAQKMRVFEAQWEQSLSGLGLGQKLDPETVREAFNVMGNCLAAEEKMANAQHELERCEKEMSDFEQPLGDALQRMGRADSNQPRQPLDCLHLLDNLLAEGENNAMWQAEASRMRTLIADDEDELRAREAALESVRQRERELFAQANASNAEDFLRMAREHSERLVLTQRVKHLEATLRSAAADTDFEQFLSSFSSADQARQESRLDEIRELIEKLDEEEQTVATEVYSCNAQVQSLSQNNELASLRQQEATMQENIKRMAVAWSTRALAKAILLKARHKFESERQPEVIRLASEIFAQITNGRWRGLRTTLDDSRLEILPAHGEPVSPEILSRGAQEQAYLAMRLAYIRNHAEHATSLPVIMDEILVNFDPQRADQAARAFARLAGGSGDNSQQILYFTCQPHMVDMLKAASPEAKLFRVENGTITAA